MSTLAISFAGIVLLVLGVVVSGVRVAASRAGDDASTTGRVLRRLVVVMALWLTLTAAVASSGALEPTTTLPPWPLPLLLVIALGAAVAWLSGERARRLLAATSLSSLIGLASFRVLVELFLHVAYLQGKLPREMTWEGRNFDVVVGLSAPLVAWLAWRGALDWRLLAAWNVAGVVVLAHTVGVAIASMPGPQQVFFGPVTSPLVARAPFVWLPAVLVPIAIAAHVAALLKLTRERRHRDTCPAGVVSAHAPR